MKHYYLAHQNDVIVTQSLGTVRLTMLIKIRANLVLRILNIEGVSTANLHAFT